MPKNPIIVYTNSVGQDLTDQLKVDGRPIDESLIDSITFNMRFVISADLKVDNEVAIPQSNGNVLYSWQSTDLDEPGEFWAWWHVTLTNGDESDTDEFLVIVAEHAPGLRTRTGAIYERARSELPYTWDALEDSPRYGDKMLQDRVEVVKLRVLNAEVEVVDEADLDIRVQDFLGKVVAINVIPAGIDYWMNQHETITTGGGGTTEIVSYPDRINALKETYSRLLVQIKNLEGEIGDLIDNPTLVSDNGIPEWSDGVDEGFVTPLPVDNFIGYHFTDTRRPNAIKPSWLPWDIP